MWNIISRRDLERMLDEGRRMALVDLQDPESYARSHIRGAVNIPCEELMDRLGELPGDRLLVLYCYHGPNSMRAARRLAEMGYETADVYGGILGYQGKYLVYSR